MNIVNRIDINAAPETVFYWLEDPDRAKQWVTSVTKSEFIEETPNRVGTTFREYVEEGGRGLEMQGVVTAFVPNQRFAVHLESKVNSVDVDFTLHPKGSMTQLIQNIEMRFKGLLRLLSVFLGGSVKKKIKTQAQSEFARLKELCEQRG